MDIARFLDELQRWVGVPFHHQGRGRAGIDCVGLALAGLAEQGIVPEVPAHYALGVAGDVLLSAIERTGLLVARPLGRAEPGDVLVFRIRRDPQHLAVALTTDRMIHATTAGVHVVTIGPLWRRRLMHRYGWRHG